MFAAILLAPSFVSNLAADRRPVRPADRAQHYKTDYERK
jgi:hypothetical protein